MFGEELYFDDISNNYIKKIDTFADEEINYAEKKSKMFIVNLNQISNFTGLR